MIHPHKKRLLRLKLFALVQLFLRILSAFDHRFFLFYRYR